MSGFNIGKVLPLALTKLGAVMEILLRPIVNLKELRKEYFQAIMGSDIWIVKATNALKYPVPTTRKTLKSPMVNGPNYSKLPPVTHQDTLGQEGSFSQVLTDSVAIFFAPLIIYLTIEVQSIQESMSEL